MLLTSTGHALVGSGGLTEHTALSANLHRTYWNHVVCDSDGLNVDAARGLCHMHHDSDDLSPIECSVLPATEPTGTAGRERDLTELLSAK